MFRQQQRDVGNPYKEGSRSWLAWAKGYDAGRVDVLLKHIEMPASTQSEANRG